MAGLGVLRPCFKGIAAEFLFRRKSSNGIFKANWLWTVEQRQDLRCLRFSTSWIYLRLHQKLEAEINLLQATSHRVGGCLPPKKTETTRLLGSRKKSGPQDCLSLLCQYGFDYGAARVAEELVSETHLMAHLVSNVVRKGTRAKACQV